MEKAKYLGEVSGLCACFSKKTLNDRGYDKIYRRLLDGQDYRFNEMMRRGGILCELGHPAQTSADFERTETDLSKACAIITKVEEGENGNVYATAKILDTPAGRIYKAIEPFYKFGFSSRGSYDAVEDGFSEGPDGWNQDTYVFKGFDIVAIPANQGSEITANESLHSKKKTRSARESLDLNEISKATDLEPEEINRELDKIFNDNGELEGSELIKMSEYADSQIKKDIPEEQVDTMSVSVTAPSPSEDFETPISKIKEDLQTALGEAAKLREDLERKDFDLQNAIAEKESISAERDEYLRRALEAEKAMKDYEEIKLLSSQLVDSYHGVRDSFESQKRDLEDKLANEAKTSSQWKSQADISANEKKLAEETAKKASEEAAKLRSRNSVLSSELKQAKESLIEVYSRTFGISPKIALEKLGKIYRTSQIKPTVEAVAKESLRLSGVREFNSIPEGKVLSDHSRNRNERLEIQDEYDRDLIEMFEQ